MTDASTPQGSLAHAAMQAEIARIRDALGLKASRMRDLFDYLAERSQRDEPTREADIAIDVFGLRDAAALRDDAVARVYVHRLRKRLDEFYRNAEPGRPRLVLPKGEYRLVLLADATGAARVGAGREAGGAGDAHGKLGASRATSAKVITGLLDRMGRMPAAWGAAGAAICLLAIMNLAAWFVLVRGDASAGGSSSVAGALSSSRMPVTVVIGDYYIFGEYEDRLFLKRLVRDFSVNSKADLVEKVLAQPGQHQRYADVALEYLPTSVAFALADLAPILAGREVRVQLASQLTPEIWKTGDVIYVGLLSGLGDLKEPLFAASGFALGESYDQLLDRRTGVLYESEAFLGASSETMYRDYGLFATFEGPTGNRVVILAGARDTGLMGISEAAARSARVRPPPGTRNFDALYEVKGQKHVDLQAVEVAAHPLASADAWSRQRSDALIFPPE